MRILRALALTTAAASFACGPRPTQPSSTSVSTTVGAETRTATPAPRLESREAEPCDPILEGAFDLAKVAELRATLLPEVSPQHLELLSDLLELPARQIAEGRVLEHLGLDPSGTASFVVCAPNAATERQIDALARLVPDRDGAPADPAREASIRRLLRTGEAPYLAVRMLLPTQDEARLRERLVAELVGGTVIESQVPLGYEEVRLDLVHAAAFGLSRVQGGLLLEFFVDPTSSVHDSNLEARRTRALEALMRAGHPGVRPEAPATDGSLARAVAVPERLAKVNFLVGIGAVLEAVDGVDPSSRARLVDTGAFEASRSLVLAGDSEGAYFERLTFAISARGHSELRAEARTDNVLGTEASFHPRQALTVEDAAMMLAVSPSFLHGFPLPGGSDAAFLEWVRFAGGIAPLYASPHRLIQALRTGFDEGLLRYDDEPRTESDARFEELAVVFDEGGGKIRLALVAEGADAREAACSFYPDPRPCERTLRVGRPITPDGEHTVMLARVDGRHVAIVVPARVNPRSIATRLSVVEGTVPVRFLLGDAGLRALEVTELVPGLCTSATGGIRREGRTLLVELTHGPCLATP